ncbi:hypothetical protein [Thermofilum sp.]
MPQVYLRKELYEKLVKLGYDVNEIVNSLVQSFLEKEKGDRV